MRRICGPKSVLGLLAIAWLLNQKFPKLIDHYSFHPDEGFNLIKGMLIAKGFRLYSDIWSDQPPLLSYIFAGLYRIFGNAVPVYRAFVLAVSIIGM